MIADDRWLAHNEAFPNTLEFYLGRAHTLRQLGRLSELDDLLSAAEEQYPDNQSLVQERALTLSNQHKWREAAGLYRSILAKYADSATISSGLGEALYESGHYDEAETVLQQARSRFPKSFVVARNFAMIPVKQKSWLEAVRRWDDLIRRFPEMPQAYVGMSTLFRDLQLTELNVEFLKKAAEQFPENAELASDYGRVFVHRQDWKVAVPFWRGLSIKFPRSVSIATEYGAVLLLSDYADEAEAWLVKAAESFPNNLAINIKLAECADQRRDWARAVERWTAIREAHPSNHHAKESLSVALYRHNALSNDPEVLTARSQDHTASQDVRGSTTDVKLVSAFESLGENCEFGLFQRAVGAEPLGLLRFAGTIPDRLIESLRDRFDGVGSPEYMLLREAPSEYVVSDSRYGMTMHTFIKPTQGESAAFYDTMLKKITYLKRKLIEDLEDGDKIFVYKARYQFTADHLSSLSDAVASYGNSTLLVVKEEEAGKPWGLVEQVTGNTMVAYIDRHGHDGRRWDIPVQSWLEICRKVYDIWATARLS